MASEKKCFGNVAGIYESPSRIDDHHSSAGLRVRKQDRGGVLNIDTFIRTTHKGILMSFF